MVRGGASWIGWDLCTGAGSRIVRILAISLSVKSSVFVTIEPSNGMGAPDMRALAVVLLVLPLGLLGCDQFGGTAQTEIAALQGRWQSKLLNDMTGGKMSCAAMHVQFGREQLVMSGEKGTKPWMNIHEAGMDAGRIRLVVSNPDRGGQKLIVILKNEAKRLRPVDIRDAETNTSLDQSLAKLPEAMKASMQDLMKVVKTMTNDMFTLERCPEV